MSRENFAIKLCGHLQTRGAAEVTAREWRLVGQEQDFSQLFTWISPSPDTGHDKTNIGVYLFESNTFELLYSFDKQLNIIQASVNDSQTLLGYVVKDLCPSTFDVSCEQNKFIYKPFILQLKCEKSVEPKLIENERNKQVMIQFLYKSSQVFIGKTITDKFLLMIHLECIKLYTVKLERDGLDDYTEETWSMSDSLPSPDTIVKSFSWTQWDPVHQVLYYIHYRLPVQSSIEGEDSQQKTDTTPTLSGLQFHQDLPHETVLNIPLNLPQLPSSIEAPTCGLYEDDAVPLRIHDCSLDLQIISNPSGIVCICHHYLYQPVDDSQETAQETTGDNEFLNKSLCEGNNQGVNFAYSVTLLHHGYVTHCVIPNLMWSLAKSLRPAFCLYKEDYLLVHMPNLYTHMLDVGLSHEPACHIVLPANSCMQGDHLVSLMDRHGRNIMVDLATLDIVRLNITNAQFISVFKSNTAIQNKLSIMHYFLQHDFNMEVVEELVSEVCNSPNESMGAFCAILKEFLIGGTYTATKSCLSCSALTLTRLLPFTTNLKLGDIQIADTTVSVSQEQLWNTTMMLLSPRQRITPFRSDMWTRLWDYLSLVTNRFRPHQVLEKLRVSLACYQPEALSRCSTPLTPGGPAPAVRRPPPPSLLAPPAPHSHQEPPLLPFIEMDTCTASKQEHIISVNLREVSMHLLRHGGRAAGGAGGEGAVHAVGARHAASQLEASRALCLLLCKALSATARHDLQRGFPFIDSMNEDHRFMLLKALETYYLAADSLAFPLPQGFSSFFTYLGYRSLSFSNFLQYVHRNVFEVQIDFLKIVMAEAGNDTKSVLRALRLAALGGGGRSGRALATSNHPAALRLRARHHAATLLAGLEPPRTHLTMPLTNARRGLAAFPSADRLSPLDTFLDLLTAKASLNELDFNLLIDATILAEGNVDK